MRQPVLLSVPKIFSKTVQKLCIRIERLPLTVQQTIFGFSIRGVKVGKRCGGGGRSPQQKQSRNGREDWYRVGCPQFWFLTFITRRGRRESPIWNLPLFVSLLVLNQNTKMAGIGISSFLNPKYFWNSDRFLNSFLGSVNRTQDKVQLQLREWVGGWNRSLAVLNQQYTQKFGTKTMQNSVLISEGMRVWFFFETLWGGGA